MEIGFGDAIELFAAREKKEVVGVNGFVSPAEVEGIVSRNSEGAKPGRWGAALFDFTIEGALGDDDLWGDEMEEAGVEAASVELAEVQVPPDSGGGERVEIIEVRIDGEMGRLGEFSFGHFASF